LGELPPLSQDATEGLVRSARIDVTAQRLPARRRAAIELFVPLGGRFIYGLLGVELLGSATSVLEVLVPISGSKGTIYDGSLANTLDRVRWGLPDEYVGAVLDGARAGVRTYGPPDAGAARFGIAAHGDVGSASSLFERLSKALVGLLVVRDDDVVDLARTMERLLE
jgi:hypothetical protein